MANTDTSQLRNRLAERANGGEVAQPDEKPLATVVRQAIDRQADAFRAVLPAGVDADRFARLTMVAIKANPKLMAAFSTRQGQTSVLLAVMQAAALGLEPNTPTEECWLQPRNRKAKDENNRDIWIAEAELSIGYKGYKKLVRKAAASNGTPVKNIFAEVVRQGDHFRWSRGIDADELEHTPVDGPGDEEAPLSHVFAVVRFADGTTDFVVMNRTQVYKRRAMSDSWKRDQKYSDQPPRSPWFHWEPEQWRKTGIRTLCKQLNLSPQLERALQSDEARLALGDGGIEALPYQDTAGELEQAPVVSETTRATLRANAGLPASFDPETGEIAQESPHDPIEGRTMFPRPPVEDDPPPAAPRVDDARGADPVEAMSKAQQGMLFGLLAELGIEDRRERLTWASATLDREVATYNELSVMEASILIDAAQRQTEGEPEFTEDGGDAA